MNSPSAPPTEALTSSSAARRRTLWLLLAAAVVLGLCFLLDGPCYHWFHENFPFHLRRSGLARMPARIFDAMESWGESVLIVVVIFAIWRLDRTRRSRVVSIVVAVILVNVVVETTKRLTGRERPEVSQGAMVWHGPTRWDDGGDYQSFPSGHTASAASFSGAIAGFYPPLRPICIVLAAGCGANRVWKERHFLSDAWLGGVFGFWFSMVLPRTRAMRPLLEWFDHRFSEPPPCDILAHEVARRRAA